MRGHEFLPQIDETALKRQDPAATRLGLALLAWGFFKKSRSPTSSRRW